VHLSLKTDFCVHFDEKSDFFEIILGLKLENGEIQITIFERKL
jgi:hypothetical protein